MPEVIARGRGESRPHAKPPRRKKGQGFRWRTVISALRLRVKPFWLRRLRSTWNQARWACSIMVSTCLP